MIKSHVKVTSGWGNGCSGCAMLVVLQLNYPLHPLLKQVAEKLKGDRTASLI